MKSMNSYTKSATLRHRVGLALAFALTLAIGCTSEPQAPAPATEPAKTETTNSEPQAATPLEPAEPLALAEPQAEPVEATPQVSEPAPIRRDDAVEPAALAEPAEGDAPQRHTSFFRLDANTQPTIAPVLLSNGHAALSKVKVGDTLPAIELPQLGDGVPKKLADLYGKTATVVVFWKGDRRMTHIALADLTPDVVDLFGGNGVAVVGIAVNETPATAQAALEKAGAKFPNLLDADGKAFAQVGTEKLPRIYLVDPQGKILWFDIEYSHSTRRELHQALRAVTGKVAAATGTTGAAGTEE